MVTVPLYDYYGMIQIFGHILGGGVCIFGWNTGLLGQFMSAVVTHSCTDIVLVPHTLRSLVSSPSAAVSVGIKSLRRLTSSSEILSDELLQKLFLINPEITAVNIYGLTEAGRACYRNITRNSPPTRGIGVPSHGVEVEIQGDRDNPGEIVLRGPNLMLGYLSGVDESGLLFKACSEMRTGDLGYRDESGEIVLLGRRDHMINLMGMKIHPSEIESVALKVAGILDARAQVGVGLQGEKAIHLMVVCPGKQMPTEQILKTMRMYLPRAFVPAEIKFVSTLERTEIGAKMLR